jgi:hypothetical protein
MVGHGATPREHIPVTLTWNCGSATNELYMVFMRTALLKFCCVKSKALRNMRAVIYALDLPE